MAGWYHVVKTIKGNRYLYAQRTWREGGHVRTQSRYLGKAGDSSGSSSSGQSAQAGLSDTSLPVHPDTLILLQNARNRMVVNDQLAIRDAVKIARLDGKTILEPSHIAEALQYQNPTYLKQMRAGGALERRAREVLEDYASRVAQQPLPQARLSKAKNEFKVGDILDPQGHTNMAGIVKIREITGNTIKFVDANGQEYSGMQRSLVRTLIKEGSWKRVAPQPKSEPQDSELTLQQQPSSAATARSDIYTDITDKIIADLEKGVRPWDRPWRGGWPSRPLRFNGEPYRGINIIMLWLTAAERGYSSPHWMTFKQARELGGHIRKGEKGTQVAYANTFQRVKLDETGEPIRDKKDNEIIEEIPYLKGYTVFNVDQIDGLPDKYKVPVLNPLDPTTRIKNADELIAKTGADISHGGDKAYYSTERDHIQLPTFATFKEPEGYVATAVHELVHWTSHPKRLDRSFGRERWGDEGYAMEELVAELGAAFVCADLGIAPKTRDEHSSYIGSWLKVLKNDKHAIFAAASHAQKAVDYLHGDNSQKE